MARETVSWTEITDAVTHTRRSRTDAPTPDMIAIRLTGGTSAVVSGPVIASNAAYNAQTKCGSLLRTSGQSTYVPLPRRTLTARASCATSLDATVPATSAVLSSSYWR